VEIMVYVECLNENCSKFGELMDLVEEDSNQESYSAVYECGSCGNRKEHRQIFDQKGLVVSDDIYEL